MENKEHIDLEISFHEKFINKKIVLMKKHLEFLDTHKVIIVL
jgi:hypothetical protein